MGLEDERTAIVSLKVGTAGLSLFTWFSLFNETAAEAYVHT